MNYRVARAFKDLDGRWKKIGELIEIKDPARARHLRMMRVIALDRASLNSPERAVLPKHEEAISIPPENASATGELAQETMLESEPMGDGKKVEKKTGKKKQSKG
jgi:hypothetical protein